MTKTKRDKRITVNLSPQDYEALRRLALKRGESVSGFIRTLIWEFLEVEEDINDSLEALKAENDSMDWETFKKRSLHLP